MKTGLRAVDRTLVDSLRGADEGRALAVLEVADRIFPDRPRACLFRARALAAAGREDAAVAAVRCALERGASRALLRDDPGLAPLRHLPAFRALAGGAR